MFSRPTTPACHVMDPELLALDESMSFAELVRKLSFLFVETIGEPQTFDELRTSNAAKKLTPLITYLIDHTHGESIVAALLALKGHFESLEFEDEDGVNESRGYACEFVAWKFVTGLSEHDAIDHLCYEVSPESSTSDFYEASPSAQRGLRLGLENQPLLSRTSSHSRSQYGTNNVLGESSSFKDEDFLSQFYTLNALEVAALVGAKKFLKQRAVQKIITGIWKGDIVFWEKLSLHATKKAKTYNKRTADLFCRLRVPRYLKAFEVLFFASFLALYYTVLAQKAVDHVTVAEIFLYIWIAGFAYDEFGELQDAGFSFYLQDIWAAIDVLIVVDGFIFLVLRIVGLRMNSPEIIDTAFDVLALEALFLFPRICSLLSLHPYFGTLIPCLKEMTKDFVKFLSVVIILYLGFLTAFTMLARGVFTTKEMSWILIKVFFGSSYLGFDVAPQISKQLGPAIMLIFVILTNILLITSLISLLSNSLTKIMTHAREEFLFGYSVYVLEASTSNRLTYYLPPVNLIPLIFRPLRLLASAEQSRSARIVLLRLTHFPHVAAIWVFENGYDYLQSRSAGSSSWRSLGAPTASPNLKRGVLRPSPISPRPLATSSSLYASIDGSLPGPFPAATGQRAPAPAKEEDDDTRLLVLELGKQVEQLTAMVAQVQSDLQVKRTDVGQPKQQRSASSGPADEP
ncbi:hypothetical protein EJ05DRAFT_479865 [Pseudovirgaria hyperparasitica]|uniref:Calcium channel YVC1-like C-terminal transmembrane domain-containing protein n=1 Tax=Pseudovirgaria hyperparasitica TaxID=470096 RepID=A0A6A6VVE2_9PEZI|nr:uncharacterized protein EJ05DRAFT_479865 [Pseudovirgaria hyperparasitica]KAF2753839.1 hypothetical protein EJ05DRAFT_479865 [Pseudovirgaria hyperparasitica]